MVDCSMSRKRKKKVCEEKPKFRTGKRLIRFYLLFGLFIFAVAVAYPLLLKVFFKPVTKLLSFTATLVGGCLNILGAGAEVYTRFVNMDNFSLQIVSTCTGVPEMLYFTAAVIAFPSSFKKKLLGILIFCPVIYLINILRTSFLAVAGNWSIDFFHLAHTYLFQISAIVFIAVFWLVWITKVVGYER
ncbi:MAG: archaeosortase/exosortase family protein [Candidatus Zixiibacteriota bacterium]